MTKQNAIIVAILAFLAAWVMQSYRHNSVTRKRVNKAVRETEKEAKDAINALLEEAENNGISISQLRQVMAEVENE